MLLLALVCYEWADMRLFHLDRLGDMNPNVRTPWVVSTDSPPPEYQVTLLEQNETVLFDVIDKFNSTAFGRLVRANMLFNGKMANKSCKDAINELVPVAKLAFKGYVSNYFRYLKPVKRFSWVVSPLVRRNVIKNAVRKLSSKASKKEEIHKFFPWLGYPEVMRLFQEVLQRREVVAELPDAPIYLEVAKFSDSDGDQDAVQHLLEVCEENFSASDFAKNVIAVAHIFNFTANADYERGMEIIMELEGRNAAALEVLLYLMLDPNTTDKRLLFSASWWHSRVHLLNPVVANAYMALMAVLRGHSMNKCEENYRSMKEFIDQSWMMADGVEASNFMLQMDVNETRAMYTALGLTGNGNALHNVFAMNSYLGIGSSWLPKLVENETEAGMLTYLTWDSPIDVFESLRGHNPYAGLYLAFIHRDNMTLANEILDDVVRQEPMAYVIAQSMRHFIALTHWREVDLKTYSWLRPYILEVAIFLLVLILASLRLRYFDA